MWTTEQQRGTKVGGVTFYVASTSSALRGFRSVHVVVEEIAEDDSNFPGLTTDKVRLYTESTLRRNGIKVAAESARGLDIPTLYVNVNTLRPAFNITVECQETVLMARQPTMGVAGAVTYQKSTLGVSDGIDLVLKGLLRVLDLFCADFKASR